MMQLSKLSNKVSSNSIHVIHRSVMQTSIHKENCNGIKLFKCTCKCISIYVNIYTCILI